MDVLGDFIVETCLEDENERIKSSLLYRAYQEWTDENGFRPLSHKRFSQKMEDRGYAKKRSSAAIFLKAYSS